MAANIASGDDLAEVEVGGDGKEGGIAVEEEEDEEEEDAEGPNVFCNERKWRGKMELLNDVFSAS